MRGRVAKWIIGGGKGAGRAAFGSARWVAKRSHLERTYYQRLNINRIRSSYPVRYVKNLNEFYKYGRDLHVARATESPWKLSMYVFKLVRRVVPWALSSGYFISRLSSWSPAQKRYFIYCLERELIHGVRVSAKTFYECVRKASKLQKRFAHN